MAKLKEGQKITIDGRDPYSRTTLSKVNIWDYEKKQQVGAVFHNDTVSCLKQKDTRVRIKTDEGISGWVTWWFIKELKEEWYKAVMDEL